MKLKIRACKYIKFHILLDTCMAYQGLSIFEGVTIKNINIFVMILQMCNVIPLQ
jgi:hypothetical protein